MTHAALTTAAKVALGAELSSPRVRRALGLRAHQELTVPGDIAACAAIVRDAHADGREVAWSAGGPVWRDDYAADVVLSLAGVNGVDVDPQRGLVTAGGGASMAAIDGALARQGWTLDLALPASLRVADAMATPPFDAPLRRRLMRVVWLQANGTVQRRDTSALHTGEGPRSDRALPLARGRGVVLEATLRARPAHGTRVRQCWTSASAATLITFAERAVRAGWPHTRATLVGGHHVELGLGDGRLRPVLLAAAAAARTRLGGGGRARPPRVVLELEVRAEPGVAEVWLAQLAQGVDLPKVGALEGARWRRDLARALQGWQLLPADTWSAMDGADCRAALEEPGAGAALRCTHATLDGHGRWLVRTTRFATRHAARRDVVPALQRTRPAAGERLSANPTSAPATVHAVRSWRRAGAPAALDVSLSALTALRRQGPDVVRAEVWCRLSDVERRLRGVGRTLGLADCWESDARVLDLLLDTPRWRVIAAATANHGARFDAMGGVDGVFGVDSEGRAGRLTRWLRPDALPGLDSVPTHATIGGWPLVPTATDWRWVGPWAEALALAHRLSVATPHLLRLAVAGPSTTAGDRHATVWVRTGDSHPGALRAVDHVRRLLPGATQVAAAPWPCPRGALTAAIEAVRAPPLSRDRQALWVSRFSRGRAAGLRVDLAPATDDVGRREPGSDLPTAGSTRGQAKTSSVVTLWP